MPTASSSSPSLVETPEFLEDFLHTRLDALGITAFNAKAAQNLAAIGLYLPAQDLYVICASAGGGTRLVPQSATNAIQLRGIAAVQFFIDTLRASYSAHPTQDILAAGYTIVDSSELYLVKKSEAYTVAAVSDREGKRKARIFDEETTESFLQATTWYLKGLDAIKDGIVRGTANAIAEDLSFDDLTRLLRSLMPQPHDPRNND